jgi:hypothetical protein
MAWQWSIRVSQRIPLDPIENPVVLWDDESVIAPEIDYQVAVYLLLMNYVMQLIDELAAPQRRE